MRSALTVLGVVIGITAIVGMTSLIRGFDQSLRDSIRQLGPNTIFVAKFSGVSLAAGRNFADLARRPISPLTTPRPSKSWRRRIQTVDIWLGAMGDVQDRVVYEGNRTKLLNIIGATEESRDPEFRQAPIRPLLFGAEVDHKRKVVVLGDTPYRRSSPRASLDPVNKKVRIGAAEYTAIRRVLCHLLVKGMCPTTWLQRIAVYWATPIRYFLFTGSRLLWAKSAWYGVSPSTTTFRLWSTSAPKRSGRGWT